LWRVNLMLLLVGVDTKIFLKALAVI